jgi:hypothetical protein
MEHFQALHVYKTQIEDNAQGIRWTSGHKLCHSHFLGLVVQIDDVVLTEDLMVLHWSKLSYAEYEAQIWKLMD